MTAENYGPWTHTLGDDREHKVQIYQTSLYETIQNMFSIHGGLVFANRFDEFFVISDGISYSTHLEMKTKLQELFPFKISMSISNSKFPFLAQKQAYMAKKVVDCSNTISSDIRKESEPERINLIHLDIDGITQTKKYVSPFEITLIVQSTHLIISQYCYEHKLMGFFMGGDNFVIVSDENSQIHSKNIMRNIRNSLNIIVNCGIGQGKTARVAMEMATKNLDEIRRLRKTEQNFPRILDSNSINN